MRDLGSFASGKVASIMVMANPSSDSSNIEVPLCSLVHFETAKSIDGYILRKQFGGHRSTPNDNLKHRARFLGCQGTPPPIRSTATAFIRCRRVKVMSLFKKTVIKVNKRPLRNESSIRSLAIEPHGPLRRIAIAYDVTLQL